MTSILWANLALAVPFVLAWVGIPLWMVLRRPDAAPDFSEAHAYLAASRPQPAVHGADQHAISQRELQAVA